MKTTLQRSEAIARIIQAQLRDMAARDREELISDYWAGLNEEETATLPEPLRQEMSNSDEPENDVRDKRYDRLIRIALQTRLRGVRNSYLEELLRRTNVEDFLIVGSSEVVLMGCPCCGYRTLSRRGQYDICAVCFWEDDGNIDPDKYSSVNHMTLKEAREVFLRVGVSNERFASKVHPDAKKMYYRLDESGRL